MVGFEVTPEVLTKESYAGLPLRATVNLYDPHKQGESDERLEGPMKDSERNSQQQGTILVIHHDVSVLVLVRGILADHYRVLLAADAESAVRLAMLAEVAIDLALIGRDTPGVRNSRELQRRLLAIRPNLGTLSMMGRIEDGVIKMRTLGVPKARTGDDLAAQVQFAIGRRRISRTSTRADLPGQAAVKIARAPQVMRAGGTIQ